MLTDTKLRNLKPQDKLYKVNDRDGLYVAVTPAGGISFRYNYSISGRQETLTIGRYGKRGVTLSEARERLSEAKKMIAATNRLVRRDAQLIQLLDPPFDKSTLEPGYIKGYVPGVRENGGQYTHAAIWATTAFAKLGEKERAWELFGMLNPINRGSQPEAIERYKVEPYVMSADIYAAAPHTGRGGWTWYTGAAGWMYRLAVETLLGLHREGDQLRIAPCVPDHWQSYKIHYRYRDTFYHITIYCADDGARRVTLDGVVFNEVDVIPLVDDHQEHHVEVVLA